MTIACKPIGPVNLGFLKPVISLNAEVDRGYCLRAKLQQGHYYILPLII